MNLTTMTNASLVERTRQGQFTELELELAERLSEAMREIATLESALKTQLAQEAPDGDNPRG